MAVTDDGSQLPAMALMESDRQTGVEMHCEDLMKPDLLSEIVLLGFGIVVFVSTVLLAVTMITHA
jgi:hypothetical protein